MRRRVSAFGDRRRRAMRSVIISTPAHHPPSSRTSSTPCPTEIRARETDDPPGPSPTTRAQPDDLGGSARACGVAGLRGRSRDRGGSPAFPGARRPCHREPTSAHQSTGTSAGNGNSGSRPGSRRLRAQDQHGPRAARGAIAGAAGSSTAATPRRLGSAVPCQLVSRLRRLGRVSQRSSRSSSQRRPTARPTRSIRSSHRDRPRDHEHPRRTRVAPSRLERPSAAEPAPRRHLDLPKPRSDDASPNTRSVAIHRERAEPAECEAR